MDIARAFTFVFDEDRYVEKLAIGTGLVLASFILTSVLIGFAGFLILVGYSLRLMRNVEENRTQVLPEWNDWGGDLVRGFKLAVVGFVWGLPALVLGVPVVIGGFMADSGDAGQFVGTMLILCSGVLMFLYGLFVLLITPGYTIAFARDEQITSGLALTEIWAWTRDHIGQVIIVAIVVFLGSMVISTVGAIVGTVLCLIGLVVTVPLSILAVSLFQYHLYGQLAREDATAPVAAAAPAGPVVDVNTAREAELYQEAAATAATGDAAADSGPRPALGDDISDDAGGSDEGIGTQPPGSSS